MRQIHPRADGLQRIHRPIPAVGRLQHHLRRLPRLGNLARQRHRVVVDAHRLQTLTRLAHPHNDRTTPVQIDTHHLPTVILIHKGPPSSWWT